MLKGKNRAKLQKVAWSLQREEAIRAEQVAKCYRQYEPPQCHELRHHYLGGSGAFNA